MNGKALLATPLILKQTLLLLLFCLLSLPVYGENVEMDKQLSTIYKKAEQATKKGNIPASDYWLARYMGLTSFNKGTKRSFVDLFPLFGLRKDLKATAFISGYFNPDFIDFFFYGPQGMWGIQEEGIDEKKREFIVRSASNENFFVEVVMEPRIERWITIKENKNSVADLPLGHNAVIVAGTLKNGEPVTFFPKIKLDSEDHDVQFVWQSEFHDLDGDGIPEIWIRYNAAWADGFSQELAIYKIKDGKELVLFKRFSGEAEGIARRLEGKRVEVGHSFTNKEATGHLLYDQHHIEIWEYRKNKFVKISERDVPNILWTPGWQDYYFEQKDKMGGG